MSKQASGRRGPSIPRLAASLRLRNSWTLWCLRKTERRLTKERRRHQLMLARLDQQLLLLKQLEETKLLRQQQLMELAEIRSYRLEQLPPPVTPLAELEQELLSSLE